MGGFLATHDPVHGRRADELEVAEAPLPTAGRGEVRVRLLASSVEYTNVVIRRHLYPQRS
jgi:NADPH:quinone reductase-like Zn-dependent oxidoreductase